MLIALLLAACAPQEPTSAETAPVAAAEAGASHEAPAAAPSASGEWTHAGAAFTIDQAIPAKTLLDDPSAFVGKTVRVEGRVADVCQKQGCWMVLSEDDKLVRVLMKDHGFSVDKDAAGTTASIEGTIVEKALDPATTAHYESESKNPEVIPEKKAEGKTYEIVATAVAIKRG